VGKGVSLSVLSSGLTHIRLPDKQDGGWNSSSRCNELPCHICACLRNVFPRDRLDHSRLITIDSSSNLTRVSGGAFWGGMPDPERLQPSVCAVDLICISRCKIPCVYISRTLAVGFLAKVTWFLVSAQMLERPGVETRVGEVICGHSSGTSHIHLQQYGRVNKMKASSCS
jgi:hypothetical protein